MPPENFGDEEFGVADRVGPELRALDNGEMTFIEATAYLETLRVPVATPGLDRMRRLVASLGHPETGLSAIAVTGTNGKGTVSRLIEGGLRAVGLRTGMYTSPHLEHVRERIAIDGEPISERSFAEFFGWVRDAVEQPRRRGDRPTHFETLTAIGLLAFRAAKVGAVVLEVGIGGRTDATNVVDGTVAVLTNVELDHIEVLGSTREEIAREKSGLIKTGSIAVIGPCSPGVLGVVERRCAEVGATLWRLGHEIRLEVDRATSSGRIVDVVTPYGLLKDLEVPFFGRHQATNAALAAAAIEAYLERPVDRDTLGGAWRTVSNPGRFEIHGDGPTVVIDVAHNPHGIRALIDTLDERYPGRSRVLVVGINPHKDAEEMLGLLVPGARAVVTTEVADAPAVPARILGKVAIDVGFEDVRVEPVPERALAVALDVATGDDVVVLTGSHYWIGEVRQLLLSSISPREE